MSTNFAEIKGHKCADCGEEYSDLDVDYMDSGGCHGLSLKSDQGWMDLSPKMIADLMDVLFMYQNPVQTRQEKQDA